MSATWSTFTASGIKKKGGERTKERKLLELIKSRQELLRRLKSQLFCAIFDQTNGKEDEWHEIEERAEKKVKGSKRM